MNNMRRKEIKKAKDKMKKFIEDIQGDIENILSDEEFAFDSMPEGLQYSIRGMDSQDAIDSLNNCIDMLSSALDELDNII